MAASATLCFSTASARATQQLARPCGFFASFFPPFYGLLRRICIAEKNMTNPDNHRQSILAKILFAILFLGSVLIFTRVMTHAGPIANETTVGVGFLILVVLSAVFAGLAVAVAVSIVATLCYNYYFFPPVGTFHIASPDNWIALFAFLFSAILISRLTASARENARNVANLDASVKGLKQLGGWILSTPRDQVTLSGIAAEILRIFSLDYCSIHVYEEGKWQHFSGTAAVDTFQQVADQLAKSGDRLPAVMDLIEEHALGLRYTQILREMRPVAVLAVKSAELPTRVIDVIASMIGVLLTEMLAGNTVSSNPDLKR